MNDLEQAYNTQSKKLYQFFFYKTLQVQIAEDLTSETFLRLSEYIKTHIAADVDALLYGFAKRVWLEYLKEKYQIKATSVENIDDFAAYAQQTIVKEGSMPAQKKLTKLLGVLPVHQRDVLHYRFIEELSLKQTAEAIGKDVNYVKVTQKRAISRLKKFVTQKRSEQGGEKR